MRIVLPAVPRIGGFGDNPIFSTHTRRSQVDLLYRGDGILMTNHLQHTIINCQQIKGMHQLNSIMIFCFIMVRNFDDQIFQRIF
jgi:hypothetical protein